MIDKEKLLKELPCIAYHCTEYMCKHHRGNETLTVSECIGKTIKNFPEEPEIDFDVLYKDLLKDCGDSCIKAVSCKACVFDFLKSKHLTAPKPFEIPVKRTWTLKKEYEDFCKSFGIDLSFKVITDKDLQYYDIHEEPDYSKIPENSIVEAEGMLFYFHCINSLGYPSLKVDKTDKCSSDEYSKKGIRIVELAKEGA